MSVLGLPLSGSMTQGSVAVATGIPSIDQARLPCDPGACEDDRT